MYRRSCGRTTERIDASRRPRIDFLVVKLTSGLRTTSSSPVLPESQAVGRGVPPKHGKMPSASFTSRVLVTSFPELGRSGVL